MANRQPPTPSTPRDLEVWAPVSTFTQITAALAAIAITAAIAYHLTRRRAAVAHRDDLASLANRAGFHTALAVSNKQIAVVLINIDGIQTFVGCFGDRALGQLPVLTAGRLQHVASAVGGQVFRLRRDKVVVLLDDPTDVAGHAARLVAVVAEPTDIQLTGRPITVASTACAGIASFSPHADRDRRLAIVPADRALRAAKRTGRGRTAVFDPATMRGLSTTPVWHAGRGQVR